MTTVYLFAHQDDEIAVLHLVAEAKSRGERLACVYLTNGAWAGVTSGVRNAESAKSLAALGVAPDEMIFLGTTLDVPDGALVEHLDRSFSALIQIADNLQGTSNKVRRFVMHAWEGGHQDHDAVHILGCALARHFGVTEHSRQFPLYRKSDSRWTMGFASPLTANGAVETFRIPVSRRFKNLRLLANYRSQARVMLKLLPLIIRDYVTSGDQRLQPINAARLYDLPNTQPMLYETWKLYTYERFRQNAQPFIGQHFPIAAAPLSPQGTS